MGSRSLLLNQKRQLCREFEPRYFPVLLTNQFVEPRLIVSYHPLTPSSQAAHRKRDQNVRCVHAVQQAQAARSVDLLQARQALQNEGQVHLPRRTRLRDVGHLGGASNPSEGQELVQEIHQVAVDVAGVVRSAFGQRHPGDRQRIQPAGQIQH